MMQTTNDRREMRQLRERDRATRAARALGHVNDAEELVVSYYDHVRIINLTSSVQPGVMSAVVVLIPVAVVFIGRERASG